MPTETGSILSELVSNPEDAHARERFVERYGPSIQKWCQTLCTQAADAEDLYQTIWCRLFVEMKSFQYDPARGRFRSWLRTVARNTWVNMLKSVKTPAVGGLQRVDDAQSDWEKMIEEFWDRELFEEAVRRVRPRLDGATWDAFRLNALQGMPAEKVAKLTGKSVAAVYVLKGRVTRMLKDEIANLDGAELSTETFG